MCFLPSLTIVRKKSGDKYCLFFVIEDGLESPHTDDSGHPRRRRPCWFIVKYFYSDPKYRTVCRETGSTNYLPDHWNKLQHHQ